MNAKREASFPVNQLCLLACDMPRQLAAAFLDEMCQSADYRREVESRLGSVALAELTPLPETSEVCALAAKLAEEAHKATLQRTMPDLSPRGTVEWMKLDAKLRWIEGFPSVTEDRIRGLVGEFAAELLRSECLSRAVFDAMPSKNELTARFPNLAGLLDLPAIKAAASQLEATAAPVHLTRFDIIRKIGSGAMATVYEAVDREQNMRVAMKTMRHNTAVDLFRLKQEFRSLADIVHPNLVRLYELISDGRSWLYTMELIDGTDFRSWVRRSGSAGTGALTALDSGVTATTITSQLAAYFDSPEAVRSQSHIADITRLRHAFGLLVEGVHAIHVKGKLHRDLKPSNVLVQPDGRVVVLDFGLVKDLVGSLSSTGSSESEREVAGSALYMSPEQAAGRSDLLTEASDWYSVGVMLFEALTGLFPFSGTDLAQRKQKEEAPSVNNFLSDLPEDLVSLTARLLARDPAARPTGEELLVELSANPEDSADIFASGPFIGRETHLERLEEAFAALRQGKSGMVHVFGTSGVGKSVLVQRFLRRIREIWGVVVLTGRCYEQESVPYKALDSLIDAVTVYLLSLPGVECDLLLPDNISALAAVFPVLARVPAIQRAEPHAIADPVELRRVAFEALRDMLRRLGSWRRLVLYIDDLQWGDVDSAAILGGLLSGSDPPRLLFLACYRAEHLETSACVRALPRLGDASATRVSKLEVSPLNESEATRLAAELLGGARSDQAEKIAFESGGLPFFIFELARHTPAGLEGRTLDLHEALWMRIEKLPVSSRRLLEAIAVAGQPVALRHVYRATGIDPTGLPGIEELRGGNLVRRSGPGLDAAVEAFHDRIRETVGARVGAQERRGYHHALARSLESDGGDDFELVANHFRGAGECERAAGHFEKAADQANTALAFDRSARLYRQVLEMRAPGGAEERRLRRALAEALGKAGRGADAALEYLRAAGERDDEEAFRLRERAAYQFCVSGLIDEGRRTFGGVLKHLGLSLPSSRRAALIGLLLRRLWLTVRGLRFRRTEENQVPRKDLDRIDLLWLVTGGLTMIDPIPGAQCQVQHLLLSLRSGEPGRVTRAMAWEATHVSMLGTAYRGRVDRLLAEASALAGETSEPYARGLIKLSGCVAAFFLADPPSCRELGDEAAAIFRDHCAGAAWELDQCNAFAYWSCYYLGDLPELARRQAVLLGVARDRGARLAESQLTAFGGPFVWLANDDPASAWEAVARVSAYWERVEYQVYHYTLLTARSQILLYEGRAAEALAEVEGEWSSVDRALLLHVELVRVYMLFLRARCALANGAIRKAAQDCRALERMQVPFAAACGRQIAAALAWRAGERETAHTLLDDAVLKFEETGFLFFARSAAWRREQLFGDGTRESEWMVAQGIRNPNAMADVNAPGFT
jgi:eukaryotic-like serine/threonine-protein kinase